MRVRNLRRVPALHQAAETPVCAELEFTGPVCNLRDIDLGIAVASAAKAAAIHSVDCRCQTRVAVAARKLGLIQAGHSVALSPSMTSKAIGFDRAMPEADFDNPACRPPGRSRPAYRGWSATAAGETGRHPASRSAPPGPERRPAHPANPPGQSRSSRGGNGCAAEVLPSCSWLVRYQISGQQLTDYWYYTHHRWEFDLPLSNPDAARLYQLPFAKYAAQIGCQDH